ncbi:MAG TPA: pilus assembly protein TadG-related protein [Rhodopila sp.]|nr:pilus assembly protein TadG-related protein [Rhodopila sp.]
MKPSSTISQAISAAWSDMCRLSHDSRGAVAIIAGAAIVVLVGMAGLVADIGHAYAVQRALQSSSDAAALAGAQDITSPTLNQAITTANQWSATSGSINASSHQTVTMVSGYPALKCLTWTGVTCVGANNANAIVVKQQSSINTWFASLFGVKTITVTATSTAGMGGGKPKPMNVMLVIDTTASMNSADTSCSIAGATRLTCAMAGARVLMNQLAPSVDQIGLMVFPGLSNTSQTKYEYDCSSNPHPSIANYAASPVYQVVPLSSNYRTSNTATTLNASSNLVLAAQGGGSGCTQGLDAQGGVGTYYADAITTAQNALTASGTPGAQNVIILLSDGDANAKSSNMPSGKASNQCHAAISAAQAAAAAGTWVYSLAYGAPTGQTPSSCSTDSPAISACQTMQKIASDPSKFYSDSQNAKNGCSAGVQSISDLVSVFKSVAVSLLPPRLLSNS